MVISGKFWMLPCTEPGRRRTVCSKGYLSWTVFVVVVFPHEPRNQRRGTWLWHVMVNYKANDWFGSSTYIIIVSLQVSACVCMYIYLYILYILYIILYIYIYIIYIYTYTYASFSKDNLSKLASGYLRVSTLWPFFRGVEPWFSHVGLEYQVQKPSRSIEFKWSAMILTTFWINRIWNTDLVVSSISACLFGRSPVILTHTRTMCPWFVCDLPIGGISPRFTSNLILRRRGRRVSSASRQTSSWPIKSG